jgi:hypothetical protein
MNYVLLHHIVANYDEFKSIYDHDVPHRRRRGCQGARLYRKADNPNDLFMIFEFSDPAKARTFASSYELEDAMKWASVVGEWEIDVIEEIERTEA